MEFAYDRYIVTERKRKAETNPGYIPEINHKNWLEDSSKPAVEKPVRMGMRNRMRAPGGIYGGRPAPKSAPPTLSSKKRE